MKQIYKDTAEDQFFDEYWKFLGGIVRVFSELYANFSPAGREKAMTALTDLLQVPHFEDETGNFFVSSQEFLVDDFSTLDRFLNEKLTIILAFVRRALNRRQKELGIYAAVEEYDDEVETGKEGRVRLTADLSVLQWFLASANNDPIESVFTELDPTTVAALPSLVDEAELTDDEMVIYDNEHRPPK